MPLFSITSRAVGETLTAAKYNSDHAELAAGIDPATTPSTEADVAHANVQTDPGEAGAESLAANMTGVIDRIKYVIAEMKGTTLWRTSDTTRTAPISIFINNTNGAYAATGTTTSLFKFHVPDGWTSGTSIFLQLARRLINGAGTARMTTQVVRSRNGAAASTLASADINFLPGDTNTHIDAIEAAGASLAVGDFITFVVTRLGDDGADTNADFVILDGAYAQWTGKASR